MPSTEVSQNDSTSPAWLTTDYIESILRKYYDDIKLKVIDFEVGPCCGKGENFIAVMFRVKATFLSGNEQHMQSLVLKTLPVDEVVSKAMGSENYDVQSKEIEFFEKVAPEFTKVLDSLDADFEVFPKAFAVDHERDVIILDDLNVKKFVMKDRLVGLDIDHMQLVVRKLAAFHASSLVVHEKNPDAFKSFDCGIFGRKVDVFQYHFRDQLKAFTDEVASWGGYEYYATKLEKMADSFIERANQSTDYDEGDFNVLLHGDLWLNNIMFKYDGDGNLQDAILIDFQLMFHGSPAVDLFYFMFTSAADDLFPEKFDELCQYYYYQLKDLLIKLNYNMKKVPTLHKFLMQIHNKYFFAFCANLIIKPILMTSDDKDADMETLMSSSEKGKAFRRRLYKNPKIVKLAKKILPYFDRKGILDEM